MLDQDTPGKQRQADLCEEHGKDAFFDGVRESAMRACAPTKDAHVAALENRTTASHFTLTCG